MHYKVCVLGPAVTMHTQVHWEEEKQIKGQRDSERDKEREIYTTYQLMHRSLALDKLVQKYFTLIIYKELVKTHFVVADWYRIV